MAAAAGAGYPNVRCTRPGENDTMQESRGFYPCFWDMHDPKKPDTIQQLYELTVSQRSAGDQWLNAVLSAARDGAETWEMYCFIHGLPTRNPGSWLPCIDDPVKGKLTCGSPACARLPQQ